MGGFGNADSTLLGRGYVAVGFAGSDFNDDTSDLPDLYPEYTFAKLPRRAWSIKAVLDYLETVPQVDMDRVAVYGFSRDGKMATIAAALDERIDGVLAGSTGVGGTLPFRLAGERNHAESVESTTRMFPDWFHPRLRFFSGRDDRLPVDGNLLVALVAPRACLIHFNLNDEVGNTFGNEAAFRNVQPLYKLLGAPGNIGMLRQPGFHSSGMDLNAGLDFLDIAFGRSTAKWDDQTLFDWDWEAWRERHGHKLNVDALPDRSQANLLRGERGAIETTEAWEEQGRGRAEGGAIGDRKSAAATGASSGRRIPQPEFPHWRQCPRGTEPRAARPGRGRVGDSTRQRRVWLDAGVQCVGQSPHNPLRRR